MSSWKHSEEVFDSILQTHRCLPLQSCTATDPFYLIFPEEPNSPILSGLGVLSLSDPLQQRHIFTFDLVEAVGVLSIDVRCRTLEDLTQLCVGHILHVAWLTDKFAELQLNDGVHLLF